MTGKIYGLETEFGVLPVLQTRDDISKKVPVRGFLKNGGRFYICISGNHPEYATPECASVRDLVKYDKAGEIIAQALAPRLKLYKNNLDYRGEKTFGCHENYLVHEGVFSAEGLSPIIPFLVTRQIFAGAGWLEHYFDGEMKYNLSQRARKIGTEFSTGSSAAMNRSIIHLKDEAHTTIGERLHLVLGDTNMSEVATYLKVGTTSLVLDLLEEGKLEDIITLENPIIALQKISEDQSRRWIGRTSEGKTISAIDIQREYLERAQSYKGIDAETNNILRRWERVLDLLEKRDFPALARQIDWAAKKSLLELYIESERKVTLDKLRSIDLMYSSIDREDSLYYALQDQGRVDRIVSDKEIRGAIMVPPRDTRAWIRGNLIGKKVINGLVDWPSISTIYGEIDIDDPFDSRDEELEIILARAKQNKPTLLKRRKLRSNKIS